jgi:hypothetical protein
MLRNRISTPPIHETMPPRNITLEAHTMELIFAGLAIVLGLALGIALFHAAVILSIFGSIGCMFATLFGMTAPIGFAPAFVALIALAWLLSWLDSDVRRYEVRR